jgi:Rhodopirellula transposase DDE domain
MVSLRDVRQKLQSLWPHLNERSRRMLAAAEAAQLGYGGVSLVSRACGLSRVTLMKGIQELAAPALTPERIRRAGGGRRSLVQHDPGLPALLESLVEPLTRGDPESPLRWTCKSTRTLADELAGRRHRLSHEKVAQLLRGMNYSGGVLAGLSDY